MSPDIDQAIFDAFQKHEDEKLRQDALRIIREDREVRELISAQRDKATSERARFEAFRQRHYATPKPSISPLHLIAMIVTAAIFLVAFFTT